MPGQFLGFGGDLLSFLWCYCNNNKNFKIKKPSQQNTYKKISEMQILPEQLNINNYKSEVFQ